MDGDDLEDLWRDCETRPKQVYQGQTLDGWWWWWWWCRKDIGREYTLCKEWSKSFSTNCVWNVMAHAQKSDFVFRGNGRVHLNCWGRQFSRLRAAEVCASAVVMLDTPCSEVVWRYWLPTPFASFPLTSLPCVTVCPHVSTGLYLLVVSIRYLRSKFTR